MISLCNDDQRKHLGKLLELVRDRELSGTEAWSVFSSPSASKKFKKNRTRAKTFRFSGEEVATYKQLRLIVKNKLFERCCGSCSYCRRPVGHYGWAWHIEHVIPKARYPAHTFSLANLTVGCVHCNMWKGSRVDKNLTSKTLPIINPVEPGFQYSEHLSFLQFGTESLSFAKYYHHSKVGRETYDLLSFREIERARAITGLDGHAAALHERITKGLEIGLASDEGKHLVELLQKLKTSIYSLP